MGGRRCCWLPKVPDIDTGVMSKWMPPTEHDIPEARFIPTRYWLRAVGPEAIDCDEQRPLTVVRRGLTRYVF